MTVDKTLADREITHGNYQDKAEFIQLIKDHMRSQHNWYDLDYDMQESLDMIITKISRILVGNSNHVDNWHDISGYAQLIEQRLTSAPIRKPSLKSI